MYLVGLGTSFSLSLVELLLEGIWYTGRYVNDNTLTDAVRSVSTTSIPS